MVVCSGFPLHTDPFPTLIYITRIAAMNQADISKLIQGIFDNIFNSITQAEPGGKPIAQASTTVLSLMKPGLAINSADFRNPWTPGNSTGSQDAAVNTAQLVDVAPNMSTLYTDSGRKISEVYKQILDGAHIPAQPTNPAVEKQLQDAEKFLFRLVDMTDPDTGAVTQKKMESQVYRDYLDNQSAYNNARIAYIGAYMEARKTATGKNTWPMVASTLQIPVKTAYDRWRAADASKVEQNIAIKTTSTQNALQLAWNQAQALFEGYGVVLDDTGTGLAPKIQRVSLLPSDWFSSVGTASGWTTFDSAASNVASSASSDFTSYGGSAGYNFGLFSIGGSAGHADSHQQSSSETNDLRVSFEYTLVTIRRPWLNASLFGTKGWDAGNLYAKGLISNGTKRGQDAAVMPLLPTSFVVVRKVKISAKWSKADWSLITSKTGGGGGFGIGPFSISGSYAHSSSNTSFTSAMASGTITVPGVQIIGFINQVVPYCPPA
jgi:hypothetical protein